MNKKVSLDSLCFEDTPKQRLTCCIIGPQHIPNDKIFPLIGALRREVSDIYLLGGGLFISGLDNLVDFLFADIVCEFKEQHSGIRLEAAIPHPERIITSDQYFQRLICRCDAMTVQKERTSDCYENRSRNMVDKSEFVIAVRDGQETGGIASMIKYAEEQGCYIRPIDI